MTNSNSSGPTFRDLNLPESLHKALDSVGYETPSPIQQQAIPHLLQGLDLLGHAPTGTGKTAAFALPLLARLDPRSTAVQIMALTPTRELAIQVAEAFNRYAAHIPGFHVLPIYGGQEYGTQIRALKRGVQVVVGTPGRVMDHMRKGTLKLGGLQALVLDEADEMLRMGFIDEVEWILDQLPPKRQMALFSATMPTVIKRIAEKHLRDPQEVSVKSRTATAETIRQRYWLVSNFHKLDAFTRILEVETFDAMLVFVRTKIATTELAERLEARGYSAGAMNGDMAQKDRERMVERLKKGSLDILVATDVAARGLDVDRISHVVNYDIPYDAEAYIHRIGRTGRAGRSGEAILFVAPRERRMLRSIEKATKQNIAEMEMPTTETVNNKRIADFKQKITDVLAIGELAFTQKLVEQYQQEHDVPAIDIAAALAQISIGDNPLLLEADNKRARGRTEKYGDDQNSGKHRGKRDSGPDRSDKRSGRPKHGEPDGAQERGKRSNRSNSAADKDKDLQRFRIEVGHVHGVKPGNIVGAIANEAGLDAQYIGAVDIQEEYSLVDLPSGMPKEIFLDLKKVWVCGQQLQISELGDGAPKKEYPARKPLSARPDERKPASTRSDDRKSAGKKPEGRKSAEGKFDDTNSDDKKRDDKKFEDRKSGSKPRSKSKSKPKSKAGSKAKGRKNAAPKKRKKVRKDKGKRPASKNKPAGD